MSNNLALPPGVDPRMLAFLQAQRQLQHPPQNNGQYPQYAQQQYATQQGQQQQQQLQQQQLQQQQQQGQRPGGDADVASFLLQLKTNQNGEPVTDAEALQQLNAARNAQQQQPLQQGPATANGVIPGYPHMASIPGMNLYSYPGMVAFPQANANNASTYAKFYNPMQPQIPIQHAPQGLAPMQQPGGVVPGLNHSQQPQSHPGMHGGPIGPSSDAGPVMTDAYIESLISNDGNNNSGPSETTGDDSKNESSEKTKESRTAICAKDDMSISLVVPKDRDLIPDALFVALGQMRPCKLQQSDRVGCYKTRALGFMGMACKHCGGQPGFGRYFPNSVRSLAQTTTSQTILKHIAGKCRFCPPHIRKAVLELQRQQAHKEHLTTGRPRYGSRKIFFQRMWTRLHGPSEDGESAVVVQADVTPERAKEEAAAAAKANANRLLESSKLSVLTTTAAPKKQPSPVSNNNTDDEGSSSPLPPKRTVMNISLSLDNNGRSIKKRKLSEDVKVASDDEEDAPVAV